MDCRHILADNCSMNRSRAADETVSHAEAAVELSVAVRTIERYVRRGLLGSPRPGRIAAADLEDFERPRRGRPRARDVARRGGALLLVAAVLGLVACTLIAPSASADDDESGRFSFYNLASDVSSYFGRVVSPDEEGDDLGGGWETVAETPSEAGAMLGYTDPDFSLSVEWLTSMLSGSSKSLGYDTLVSQDSSGERTNLFEGLLDYAHFGAANRDLGLDSMSSGIGAGFLHMAGGGVIWLLYVLAAGIPLLFKVVVDILQLLNPFRWFHDAWMTISPTFAGGISDGQGAPGPLTGLARWISSWYGALVSISWTVLVPLFLGVLLLSLIFLKQGRRSRIKKFIVRIVFIGLGLPLLGSMYTGVLTSMAATLGTDNIGATRVVLSTYVDTDAWAVNTRLRIPENASISWDSNEKHALPESTMSVRTTALEINKISHRGTFDDITTGTIGEDPSKAWSEGSVDTGSETSSSAFLTTLGILTRYMTSDSVEASSLETQMKGAITRSSVDESKKKRWFEDYDEDDLKDRQPSGDDDSDSLNPVIATRNSGLSSSDQGGPVKTFHSNTAEDCGYQVSTKDGKPLECNLSPLAMYNYLNTGFGPDSLKTYSSNKATSGFTREQHNSVSQVGTGSAGFLYWINAVVVLLAIVLIGFAYGLGMLWSALSRTFGLIGAIPFATLGLIGGIAKVIIYSVALIAEVLVTLFLYQFVSEVLISLPQIIEAPFARWTSGDGLLAKGSLSAVAVYLMTFLSIALIMTATIVCLRARKGVIKAIEEAVTKLVDKFLEVDVAPPAAGRGGVAPAVAAGAGHGLAHRAMGGGGNGPNASKIGSAGSTNAGGANTGKIGSAPQARPHGPGAKPGELGPGKGDSSGPGEVGSGKPGDGPDGSGGTPMLTGGSKDASMTSKSDKEIARSLSTEGKGLSKLSAGSGGTGTPTKGSQTPGSGIKRSGAGGSGGAVGSKPVPKKTLSKNGSGSGPGSGITSNGAAPAKTKTLGKSSAAPAAGGANGKPAANVGGSSSPSYRNGAPAPSQHEADRQARYADTGSPARNGPRPPGGGATSAPNQTGQPSRAPSTNGGSNGQSQPAQPAQPARQVRGENAQRAQRQATQRPPTQPQPPKPDEKK